MTSEEKRDLSRTLIAIYEEMGKATDALMFGLFYEVFEHIARVINQADYMRRKAIEYANLDIVRDKNLEEEAKLEVVKAGDMPEPGERRFRSRRNGQRRSL